MEQVEKATVGWYVEGEEAIMFLDGEDVMSMDVDELTTFSRIVGMAKKKLQKTIQAQKLEAEFTAQEVEDWLKNGGTAL